MEGTEGNLAEELNKFLGKFFKNSSYDRDTRILRIENFRVVVVFSDILVTTQKKIESLMGIDAASTVLYESYKEAGRKTADLIQKSSNIKKTKLDEAIAAGLNLGGMMAWGRWDLRESDRLKAVFVVRNSPFAEAYGKSERPVCHPLRGISAGFAEYLTGERRECVEIHCKAKGDQNCEFLIATPENITKLALERSKRR